MGSIFYGKTLGIIGYGKVGRYLHKILKNFGVKILIKDNAKLTANGNNDSRIIFQAENNNWSGIKSTSDNSVTFDYTEFRNVVQYQVQLFQGNNSSTISNSLFIDCFSFDGLSTGFNISDSNIIENDFANHIIELFNNF